MCVRRIQERRKRLQNLESEGQKVYLIRDVMFDEASMIKLTDSQLVKSKTTDRISQ